MIKLLLKLLTRAKPPRHEVVIYDVAPLLAMAGVTGFRIRWPSNADVIAIGLLLQRERGDEAHRTFSVLLQHLAGFSPATARRLVLAHLNAVAGLFAHAFREMRAALPEGDPRLNERLPAALAGEDV